MQQDRPFRSFWILTGTWFAILLFFRLFPSIDIGFSSLFYTTAACAPGVSADRCGMFPLGEVPIFAFIRTVLFYLPVVVAIALVASLIVPALDRRLDWPEISRRNRLIALGAWILSTGVIVNMLLKAYSGRPRPADASVFSGQWSFMPAGSFGGSCTSNCSFISGEAASAGWLFCLLALMPPAARRWMLRPVLAVSISTALLRVMFGRHFLSDAILAWLAAVIVFELLATVLGWSERKNDGDAS